MQYNISIVRKGSDDIYGVTKNNKKDIKKKFKKIYGHTLQLMVIYNIEN